MEEGAADTWLAPPPHYCGEHVGVPNVKVTCVAHERKGSGWRVITAVLLFSILK
jgi:hypothetical protein